MSQTTAIAKLKQQLQHLVNLRINMPVNNNRDFQYPGGYEELVLAQGTAMTAQPLPENFEPGQPKMVKFLSDRQQNNRDDLTILQSNHKDKVFFIKVWSTTRRTVSVLI